jgi:hypothetical protein
VLLPAMNHELSTNFNYHFIVTISLARQQLMLASVGVFISAGTINAKIK